MRRFLMAALAAGGVSFTATAAMADTGSGAISFNFTAFSGPFGVATPATLSDPSQWLLLGSVNGVVPTPDGSSTPAGNGLLYAGGTTPLSGQSVDMVYTNLPGAADNIVSFTPTAGGFNNVSTGQDFVIGTLSFTNGQWVGGSGNPATNFPTRLDFTLQTTSSTAAFNQTIHDSIVMVTNQAANDIDCATNPQTQQDEADFIYIAGAPVMGSMRVYDSFCAPAGVASTGSVQLVMHFGSLDYVGFQNPTGGAFLTNSVTVGGLGGAPEPASWALLVAGFGLLGAELRRRRAALA